jgi:curved DNA-binding protein CbpA
MPTPEQIRSWAELARTKNYYEILRLQIGASPAEVKAAFHVFALRFHPDQFVDHEPEAAAAAAEVFKRGVEAYQVLGKPETRALYDKELAKGRIRMDPDKKKESAPPPPPQRTLEMIARTPAGKRHAAKADRLLSIGKLEDARIALTSAFQQEPNNSELQERINILYEALALEPG